MAKYIKLSTSEKEEIRRLTQKANRRIKAFVKTYEQAGYKTIPKEVTAGLEVQSRGQWLSDKYALSRSVKFESKEDYKRHLNMLKKFDPGRADSIPTVREYNKINRTKLQKAFETSGLNLSSEMQKKIKTMSAPDISKFWKEYQVRARRKGMQYSSEAVMIETTESFSQFDNVELMKKSMKGS